jgi:hypothetical protein
MSVSKCRPGKIRKEAKELAMVTPIFSLSLYSDFITTKMLSHGLELGTIRNF